MNGHNGFEHLGNGRVPVAKTAVAGLVGVLLIVFAAFFLWHFWSGGQVAVGDGTRPVTPRGNLAEDERATIEIFRTASPSVTHITRLAVRGSFLNRNLYQIPEGTGSGFIWDQAGHVVTNYHVVRGASGARVTLADHSTWPAKLVGVYPDNDLAVLKIDAPADRLTPILVGSSDDLEVGQKVFAIGNPFGLDQSLTTGVISALGREIATENEQRIRDVIQTDAAINPGNSGGPLLDSSGRLIGVNTAIYSTSGGYMGVGFAVPVDDVSRVVPRLIQEGAYRGASFGAQLAPDAMTRQTNAHGALLYELDPGGPAARAGLRPTRWEEGDQFQLGDLIVALDGKAVKCRKDLRDMLSLHRPGDTVRVTAVREGKEDRFTVTLVGTGK